MVWLGKKPEVCHHCIYRVRHAALRMRSTLAHPCRGTNMARTRVHLRDFESPCRTLSWRELCTMEPQQCQGGDRLLHSHIRPCIDSVSPCACNYFFWSLYFCVSTVDRNGHFRRAVWATLYQQLTHARRLLFDVPTRLCEARDQCPM